MVIAAFIGLLSGLAAIALARRLHGEHWLYALSLISLPSLYAGFAWYAGADAIALRELATGAPYFLGALLLMRRRSRWATAIVGALWLAHGGYDLIHPHWFINPGVPAWYPAFCAGVDVVIGLYLLGFAVKPLPEGLRTA